MDQPLIWQVASPPEELVRRIKGATGLSELTARLLVNRGIVDPASAESYLNPRLAALHDPFTLPDMEAAVARLGQAIRNKERIFLHGDYDADGITSTAIGVRALEAVGADVVGFVPSRSEGYDLQEFGVNRAIEAGATLILTADCGISAVGAVEYANSRGIDVIITDHHRPGEHLPAALAVVNPYRVDLTDSVPFQALCGAAVLFKTLDALMIREFPHLRDAFQRNFVELVALGTVADVTPLIGENRIFVAIGLHLLGRTKKAGLRALLSSLKLPTQKLTAEHIAFKVGPRLNAAGRLAHAEIAYRLLISRDPEEAESLAQDLEEVSSRTRAETARVTTEALLLALLPEQDHRRVLVLAQPKWGKGVLGIAAIRVAEQMRRPTILLSIDDAGVCAHGSARSYGGFNLHDALAHCAGVLDRFGGHSQSAGLSLQSAQIDAFRTAIDAFAAEFLPEEPPAPVLAIDAETPHGHAWSFQVLEEMEKLAPFGRENTEPVFVTRGAQVLQSRRIGADNKSGSFYFRLPGTRNDVRAFALGRGDWVDIAEAGSEADIVYSPRISEWQGSERIELCLHDVRASR